MKFDIVDSASSVYYVTNDNIFG